MKKIVKKMWIGAIAIATLIVGACCSHKTVVINGESLTKSELKARINELKSIIEDREMSCVYGSPEIIAQYGQETSRMRNELETLQNELENFGRKQ